jgi:hypothetical protein
VLSRPFTLFDQLLYGLEKRAAEVARLLQPNKDDFMMTFSSPSAQVIYAKSISRVGIRYERIVKGMDEPWRKVCERHLTDLAKSLYIWNLGSQAKHPYPELKEKEIKFFFSHLLGPVGVVAEVPCVDIKMGGENRCKS